MFRKLGSYEIISRMNESGLWEHAVYRCGWFKWRRVARYHSYLLAIKAVRDMQARDK